MKPKLSHNIVLNRYKSEILFSFELLENFILNVEDQIEISIKHFNENKETLVLNENTNSYNADIIDIYKGLDSQTWNLEDVFEEYFPNLHRQSNLITLVSFLESELNKLCKIFKESENYKVDLKDINGKGIDRSIIYLTKVVSLNYNKNKTNWNELKNIQGIRNLIVHNAGKLFDLNDNVKKEEKRYINSCEFLSGESEVILKKGFLLHVLNVFKEQFAYINNLIHEKYNKIDQSL